MRADVKSELQMLREIAWFELHRVPCCFCECLLIDSPGRLGDPPTNLTFGHRRHKSFPQDITLHHMDENRENNIPKNLRWCHESCHKSYHAKKRAAYRKEVIKQHGKLEEEKTLEENRQKRSDEEVLTPGGLHE